MEEQESPTHPRALLPDLQQLQLQQQQLPLQQHELRQETLQALEIYQMEHRLQQRMQSVQLKILTLHQILGALPPVPAVNPDAAAAAAQEPQMENRGGPEKPLLPLQETC